MHLCNKWHRLLNCGTCTTVFWLLQKKKGLALWISCMKSAFSACLSCFWASCELLQNMSALFTERGVSWLSSFPSPPLTAGILPASRSGGLPCPVCYVWLGRRNKILLRLVCFMVRVSIQCRCKMSFPVSYIDSVPCFGEPAHFWKALGSLCKVMKYYGKMFQWIYLHIQWPVLSQLNLTVLKILEGKFPCKYSPGQIWKGSGFCIPTFILSPWLSTVMSRYITCKISRPFTSGISPAF